MNIRLRAVARTAGMFAIATLVPLVLVGLFRLDAEILFNLFLLSFFSWMIWVVYSINLGQLETEEQLREMQERRETMLSNIVNKQE
jgi:nitrogen fixation/metabolism regulation signal transduction histidine kinase